MSAGKPGILFLKHQPARMSLKLEIKPGEREQAP
jgi:hypothetical protein